MELLIKILITYGIAYLFTESFLLEKPRNYITRTSIDLLANIVYCSTCMSYWIALILTGNILESFAIMGAIAIINKIR